MTNAEKYKTANERISAFRKMCSSRWCDKCSWSKGLNEFADKSMCAFHWLESEAEEEKPLPCPFCGGECNPIGNNNCWWIICKNCKYTSANAMTKNDIIAAHNRVAKAVADATAEEGEAEE